MSSVYPENVGMCSKRLQSIHSLSKKWVDPALHQTIVMLILRKDSIVFHEAVGSQLPTSESPDTPLDAIFPVASLSKLVTATAMMTLVEDGLLSLHNPVIDFIPEFKGENKEKVRIWHLLTHTLGGYKMEEVDDLLYRWNVNQSDTDHSDKDTIQHFLSLGYETPLRREPGTVVGYSNYGYELLGEIIRRVSGEKLETYTENRIFKPLQMRDTHFILPKDKYDRLVKRPATAAYADVAQYFFSGLNTTVLFETPWASSGLCTTAQDMAVFGQLFLTGGCVGDTRILSPTTVAYMKQNQTVGLPDGDRNEALLDASRGIGWDIPGVKKDLMYANLYSPSTVSHSGAGGSLVWVDSQYDLVGVFLSVELNSRTDFQRCWAGDRFINAVTSSIIEI